MSHLLNAPMYKTLLRHSFGQVISRTVYAMTVIGDCVLHLKHVEMQLFLKFLSRSAMLQRHLASYGRRLHPSVCLTVLHTLVMRQNW